jgi:hypothetical protein
MQGKVGDWVTLAHELPFDLPVEIEAVVPLALRN